MQFLLVVVVSLMFGGGSGSNTYTAVSAVVQAYEPVIQKYAKQYGIPEYVELIKAVMMQESGGRGLDRCRRQKEVLTRGIRMNQIVSKIQSIRLNVVCRNSKRLLFLRK